MKTKRTILEIQINKNANVFQYLTVADLKESRDSIISHIIEQAGSENVIAVMNKMVEIIGSDRCEKELALKAIDILKVSKFKNAAEELATYHRNLGRKTMSVH